MCCGRTSIRGLTVSIASPVAHLDSVFVSASVYFYISVYFKRYQLADLLVDELDEIGVDAVKLAGGMFVANTGISLPFADESQKHATKKLQAVINLINDTLNRSGIRIDNFNSIMQECVTCAKLRIVQYSFLI